MRIGPYYKGIVKSTAISLAAVLAFLSMPVVRLEAAVDNAGTSLYVSMDGNDGAKGTLEDPLKTLEGARDKIREMKGQDGLPDGGVTVNIRGGSYLRGESFLLEEQDSGTADSPIIYRAYDGEPVEITGSAQIDGSSFEPVKEDAVLERLDASVRDKVVMYDVKANHGVESFAPIPKNGFGWPARPASFSILVDGEAQIMGRYPNKDFIRISSVVDRGFDCSKHQWQVGVSCDTCSREAGATVLCKYPIDEWINQKGGTFDTNNADLKQKYPLWAQEPDIWVSGYFCWDWADDSFGIKTISETANGIRMTGKQPSRYGIGGNSQKFYAFNLLCEIDVPGEYYLDRESGKVYLYPQESLEGKNVTLSMMPEPLVKMDHTGYVQWQNIAFTNANSHGIQMSYCNDSTIAGCSFSDLGQLAVYMGDPANTDVNVGAGGGSNNTIQSCDITRTGQGGIYVGGGNRYTLTPGNNKVVNCDISDFATVKRTYAPAVQLVGCGNSVERSRMYDAPHAAILYNGSNLEMVGNEIFGVCYETSDAGAIYTSRKWTYQGCLIKNNYIHDMVSNGGIGSAAVYVDDLASGTTMTENLFVNIPGRTALIGGGRDNVITNNITLNNGNGTGFTYDSRGLGWASHHATAPGGESYVEITSLRANEAYDKEKWDAAYPSLAAIDLETKNASGLCTSAAIPANALIEKNIMVGVSNPYGSIDGAVKNNGTVKENESYAAGTDIGFANAEAYDYTVTSDSLIKEKLGDRHFDVAQMGLYEDEFRKLDLTKMDPAELIAPVQGAVDVAFANGTQFEWSSVEHAGTYMLEIATDAEFENIVKKEVTKNTDAAISGLEKQTTYYWRVTARENRVNGAASVSAVNSFTTLNVDKTMLQKLYDMVKDSRKEDYTSDSWSEFAKALQRAEDELASKESTMDSVKEAQELLKKCYDELEYLIPNMVENSGFESGTMNGFGNYPPQADRGVTSSVTTEDAHTGSYSAKVTTTDSIPFVPGQGGYVHKGIECYVSDIEVGASYEISFWAKSADQKVRNMWVWTPGQVSEWMTVDSEWTKLTFTTPKVTDADLDKSGRLRIIMSNENTTQSAGTYYIDDVAARKVPAPTLVESVVLSSHDITAKTGQQIVLDATVLPENASNKEVSWDSSDNSVATVEDGVVTTVSTGDAVITVTTQDGGFTDTCAVKVEEPDPVDIPVDSVSMGDAEITLKEGEEYDLTATVSPGDATNQSVTWSSSVGEVASVSDGHVKALSEGVTVITVTTVDGGYTASCRVTVEALDPGDIPVNKSLLQSTYDKAKELDTTGVVDSAVKYFKDAMATAEAVLLNPEATEEEVLDAWNGLVKAIHGLGLLQGDKEILKTLVNRADGMVENADKYVALNWQKLLDERAKAKAVLTDGDAMAEDIKPAEDALLNAILIQRLKANKENLKDLIDRASAIDESLYTEESVQIFRSALSRAMTVLGDEKLSEDDQLTVDQAEKELEDAIAQLEEKEGGNPTDPTDPTDPGNPDEPTDPEDPSGPEDPGQPENPSEPEDSGDGAGGSDAGGDGQDTGNLDGSGTNGDLKAPKTGDGAPFGMIASILGLGVLCIGGTIWCKKRER